MGGIGKTQTAVEYAYRYRESYDAVLWARADSADLLVSDFLLIAALLNLPLRNEQDQSVVVKAVIRWFDTHDQWLLILDNADNMQIVGEFIPSTGKGDILLTTRAHSTGTVAQRIELDKMGLEEGTLFLFRRANLLQDNASSLKTVPEAVRSQAQEIVKEVDGLPLPIDQAGAYIEKTGCSLTDYLKFYKTRHSRLLRMRGRSATGHPEPVATTWSLSFEKVELANPAAAELLRLCAFLHPDEISEAMIVEGASELGPILQPAVEDGLELNEAIGELRKYSQVKRDPEFKLLNIHRLVQSVIKDAMEKKTQWKWT
jgi:NB-ARC domain